MSGALVLPALVAGTGGIVAGLIPWPVRPMLAVRLLTAVAVVVSVTVMGVLVLVAAGFSARVSLLAPVLASCPVIPAHHEVSYLAGVSASILLAAGLLRVLLVRRRWRRAISSADARRFRIVDDAEVIAFAVPGDPGGVVVSRGLLDRLEPRERKVVFAHERAHLRLGHHRYLYASELAAALVPFLIPLAAQIRLATERSADEAAVDALEGDRRLVARALARVALSQTSHDRLVAAFGGSSVPLRVQALVGPPRHPSVRIVAAVAVGTVAIAAAVAGAVQLHHFAELVSHLCGF